MKKHLSMLAGGVAAAAFAAGAAQAESVKIGYMATFSGPPGVLGEHNRDGFQLGIEHLGGTLGDLDVEIIEADDQLKPDVGKQIIDRYLQSDRVDFVVGIIFSNVMMAVYEDVVGSETFLISTNAGPSPIAGESCSEYFFSTSWQNDQLHGAAGLQAVNDGVESAFLIAPNYQAGRDAMAGFKREFEGHGTIAGEILTQINQPDYSAEIAQIAAAGADAVFIFLPGGMGVNFVKQYASSGIDLPLYSGSTVDGTTLPAIGEEMMGGYSSPNFWAPDMDTPVNQRFMADFEERFGYIPSVYAAQGYDAAALIDSAIRAVDGDLSNKEGMRDAMRQADFESIRGDFQFGNNHFPVQDWYAGEVVSDDQGRATIALGDMVAEDFQDAYHQDCAMQW
ncbi:ABC transporter substrate-binding protein [Aquibaculum arenosum]|uniref:ABC transporter substrate-binding protein n=1 Tax=Aquibaculum arenosum TaxID=3032591 RepID=A0ABT5YNP2_9PROT|nr:ABC transporter substrate-binding protein [Fodinicurvata sp. CAU 1616]MDF2096563.1 ABC transporter substrate-binding protein [Fodinicurvata sp. CAU 1616]